MPKREREPKTTEATALQLIFENILSLPPKAWGFKDEAEKLAWLAKQYEAWAAAQVTKAKAKAKVQAKAKAKPKKKTSKA